ncbi:hypothetical protein TCAL_16395 [Tigriopus californicus]|uniref:Uncharacterized protein n=1 Tax=Tigriopus californicus TaxID=6832 RepID=A0A553NXW0_TIGCA|nr:hypothetical protein TCAL_16395 [Tigriopus californicus]
MACPQPKPCTQLDQIPRCCVGSFSFLVVKVSLMLVDLSGNALISYHWQTINAPLGCWLRCCHEWHLAADLLPQARTPFTLFNDIVCDGASTILQGSTPVKSESFTSKVRTIDVSWSVRPIKHGNPKCSSIISSIIGQSQSILTGIFADR